MKKIAAILVVALLASCKTYTVAPESFRSQFTGVDSKSKQAVEINNPLSPVNIKYNANQLAHIMVKTKDGAVMWLENSPALETRVTMKNGKRYHFYFDTLVLEQDSLSGGRSRFMPGLTRKLPFDSIVKIEIQDGGKKYSYQ
jgi:hypothetical protein